MDQFQSGRQPDSDKSDNHTGPNSTESGLRTAILDLRVREDQSVGATFAEILELVPERFHQWEQWFQGVPRVGRKQQSQLSNEADIINGGPHALTLTEYGIRPASFFQVAHGIELLVNRLIRNAKTGVPENMVGAEQERFAKWIREQDALDGCVSIDLVLNSESGASRTPPAVPYGLLLANNRSSVSECPPEAAEPILRWLVEVSQFRPNLIGGYVAQYLGEGEVRLIQELTEI